ncbi:MAG TPA: DUF2703 domain-containing protein [Nitrospiria bacterium]
MKKLKIDFLFLDLSTCKRCIGTHQNLEEALRKISTRIKNSGYIP